MQRQDVVTATVVVLSVVTVGSIVAALLIVSTRMAYHRAYTEIASSCQRVSLLTVGKSRYFCAPVARMEVAAPAVTRPATASGEPVTRL